MECNHTWTKPADIGYMTFKNIVNDFKLVLLELEKKGVILAGYDGTGDARIDYAEIKFNGLKCQGSCDTFRFRRIETTEISSTIGTSSILIKHSSACKTRCGPYDIVVIAFLIVAKKHLGDQMTVKFEGPNVFYAKLLCEMLLDYGLDFKVDGSN